MTNSERNPLDSTSLMKIWAFGARLDGEVRHLIRVLLDSDLTFWMVECEDMPFATESVRSILTLSCYMSRLKIGDGNVVGGQLDVKEEEDAAGVGEQILIIHMNSFEIELQNLGRVGRFEECRGRGGGAYEFYVHFDGAGGMQRFHCE